MVCPFPRPSIVVSKEVVSHVEGYGRGRSPGVPGGPWRFRCLREVRYTLVDPCLPDRLARVAERLGGSGGNGTDHPFRSSVPRLSRLQCSVWPLPVRRGNRLHAPAASFNSALPC